MDIAWPTDLAPALDADEDALGPRAIAAYQVACDFVLMDDQTAGRIADPEAYRVALMSRMGSDPGPICVLSIDRNQIFGAREHKNIRVDGVEVRRQPLVGFSGD